MNFSRIKNFFHHLFIPKEDNNFRSKLLHLDFLSYYLLLALFFTFLFKATPLSNILGYATDISIQKLYELTNQERQKYNLPPLNYNEKLSAAAYQKALDMFNKNYWAHFGPNGETPWQFILNSGYQYEYAGENLAKNFLFSQNVVSAWMNSPTHRENILRKDYTDIGFAVVNGNLNGEPTTLVVQMFGKPQENVFALNPIKTQPVIAKEENQPKPNNLLNKPQILAKNERQKNLSTSSFFFNFNLAFITFLITTLILDFYFANKMGVLNLRLTGKNLAHLIFLGFIIIGVLIISRGAII
jgi:uncharacterized protein YkwD